MKGEHTAERQTLVALPICDAQGIMIHQDSRPIYVALTYMRARARQRLSGTMQSRGGRLARAVPRRSVLEKLSG